MFMEFFNVECENLVADGLTKRQQKTIDKYLKAKEGSKKQKRLEKKTLDMFSI